MSWYDSAWNWITDKIGTWVHDSSWLSFAKVAGGALIILTIIAIVGFWWWLLHKALNHGGDH